MGSLVQPLPQDASPDDYTAWQEQHSQEHATLNASTAQLVGVSTGNLQFTASRSLTGTVLFNYIRIGNLNTLWCTQGITGNSSDILLQFSSLPSIMTPSKSVSVVSGGLINGGSSTALGSVNINPDGTILINGYLSQANGVTGGQSLNGFCGINPGFTFTFPTI